MPDLPIACSYCHSPAQGSYCSSCGQALSAKRLTLASILHEAFHFFTHLDHGFPYTLKRLIAAPGRMQREYIEGVRAKYQKPFSMFFICASIAALVIYWVHLFLIQHLDAGDTKEALFFHKYWVLLQVLLLPVFSLINYLLFKKAGYNYGEMLVFQLYLFSFFFILLMVIHLLKLVFPDLETRYIELPVFVIYTIITKLHFFRQLSKPVVIVLSVISIVLCFALAGLIQDFLVANYA